MGSVSLKLPKYKVPNPEDAVPFTDFENFNWSGKLINLENLKNAPVYGTDAIGQYGGPVFVYNPSKNLVIKKPRICIYLDEGNPLGKPPLTEDQFSLLSDAGILIAFSASIQGAYPFVGSLSLTPQNYFSLFPTNNSVDINNPFYMYGVSGHDGTGVLTDFTITQGKVLDSRFYGGELLIIKAHNLDYFTDVDGAFLSAPDIQYGLNAMNTIGDGSGHFTLEYTLREELINLIQENFTTALTCFEKIKVVLKIYWHESAKTVAGLIGDFTPALDTEFESYISAFSEFDFFQIDKVGEIPNTDIFDKIISGAEIWSIISDFFGVSE